MPFILSIYLLVMCHLNSYMTIYMHFYKWTVEGILYSINLLIMNNIIIIIGKKHEDMTNSEFEIQYYKYSSPNLGSSY